MITQIKIREIIKEADSIGNLKKDFNNDSSFKLLGLAVQDINYIYLTIMDKYNVDFPENTDNISTVNNIIKYVNGKLH